MKFKNLSEQLSVAINIATKVHVNQFDKGGKPYILHPLYLMTQLLYDYELATIGVLHDTIEDSDGVITLELLKESGFSNRVILALDLLTHKDGADYLDDYIYCICENYDAIRVKRKDLEHNSMMTRLKGMREKDVQRMIKYQIAFTRLGEARAKFK